MLAERGVGLLIEEFILYSSSPGFLPRFDLLHLSAWKKKREKENEEKS
jgi:hypothetical protein